VKKGRILAAVGVAALLVVVLLLTVRDRTPALTRAAYEEARLRWSRSAMADYDLDLLVEADRLAPQRYRVEVRGGQVTRFEQNGRLDSDGSAGAQYTVPALFEVIERELEMAAGPTVPGAPVGSVLRGEFDPERGYPLVFKRIARRGQSTFIRMERFTPRAT